MNIVVIGRTMPNGGSSVGKFEFDQARLLAQNGQRVAYIYSDNRSIKDNRRIGDVEKECDGVLVLGASLPLSSKFLGHFTDTVKTRALARMLAHAETRLGGIDVVYVHFPLLASTRGFFDHLEQRGIPVVVMEHWSRVMERSVTSAQEDFICQMAHQASAFCCVSEDLKTSIEAILSDRGVTGSVSVVPNYISNEFGHFGLSRVGFDFVAVGRLVGVKRFDLLLDAYAKTASLSDTRLLFVGEGPMRHSIERRAHELGIDGNVDFYGWKESAELAQILNCAGCYVSASPIETFGVPFAEAWMCGAPCVAPDNNPLRADFHKDNGILFPVNDGDALTAALDKAYERRNDWDAEKISAWAQERFSGKAVLDLIMGKLVYAVEGGRGAL